MRKKPFDIKKLLIFGGIPAALAGLLTFVVTSSKTITVYADLPQAVNDNKTEIMKIDNYIEKQQMQNELMQKIVNERSNSEKILSEDKRKYFDEETKTWRKI